MTIAFLLTTLVVVVTPGAGVLFTLSAGLTGGHRAALLAAVSGTLATLPHLLAAVTGLAALLHSSALAFDLIKYVGVGYLLWLAVATVRERGAFTVDDHGPAPPAGRIIGSAVAMNLLNPKLTIFFVAFLPQFVEPGSPGALGRMLGLGAVFTATTLVVFVGYGLGAAAVRRRVLDRPRVADWLRRCFAGSFLGLGLLLARAEA
ncbi:LysE family translocator [Micromonospora sediminimaris]|uniref:Lysine transporter LysE n=1 Tax=Micromonospora sediminimaris TaxID=547162 RepID=A0A9W5XMR4_9ACTN|nr:LysE family translocator [Micromonospora sediminimaris]GIJ36437.1 lysine transporter LysE [Micromonospora sediminimaris]SFD03245.1 Threonine/homoserine/homoserine lactone efflux protein [Micromonospora sediminimaris]